MRSRGSTVKARSVNRTRAPYSTRRLWMLSMGNQGICGRRKPGPLAEAGYWTPNSGSAKREDHRLLENWGQNGIFGMRALVARGEMRLWDRSHRLLVQLH